MRIRGFEMEDEGNQPTVSLLTSSSPESLSVLETPVYLSELVSCSHVYREQGSLLSHS